MYLKYVLQTDMVNYMIVARLISRTSLGAMLQCSRLHDCYKSVPARVWCTPILLTLGL